MDSEPFLATYPGNFGLVEEVLPGEPDEQGKGDTDYDAEDVEGQEKGCWQRVSSGVGLVALL
jgi:hypothetical protein